MAHRDLILTTLHRVQYEYVAPFILSLERTGFSGDVAVFASALDNGCISELQRQGAIVMPFKFRGKRTRQEWARLWPLWRWFFATGAAAPTKERLAHGVFHLCYRRHLLYLEFLRRHGADYDRVMLADARDVFFQMDPFSWNPTAGVHFVLEDGTRLGHCQLHRRWLTCQFGKAFADRHAEAIASCAGTTFGSAGGIGAYLEQMVALTMQARNLAKTYGGDQGIHNCVLIEKRVSPITVHPNRHGPVLTMGVMRPSDVRMNSEGAVLNDNGDVVPVLHQYQHIPGLKEHLWARLLQRTSVS